MVVTAMSVGQLVILNCWPSIFLKFFNPTPYALMAHTGNKTLTTEAVLSSLVSTTKNKNLRAVSNSTEQALRHPI